MTNEKQNIPIFIINLKKDVKKKQHIKRLFNKYNLNFEIIDAINGKSLKEGDISNFYSKEISIQEFGRELAKGELGCALSHKKIYKKMVDENIKTAVICEDDIIFDEYFVEFLNLNKKLEYLIVKKNLEILLLGHYSFSKEAVMIEPNYSIYNKQHMYNNYYVKIPCEKSYGTHAYFLTLNGAKKLLDQLHQIVYPIDHYTGNYRFINVFAFSPPLVKLSDLFLSDSNILDERNKYEKIEYERRLNKKHSALKKLVINFKIYNLLHLAKETFVKYSKKFKYIDYKYFQG